MKRAVRSGLCLADLAREYVTDTRGASAVEFAIISTPFFFLLLSVVQIGVFFAAQSALNTGVIKTTEMLRNNFTTGTTAVLPSAATLKSSVATSAGALIANDGTLAVEIRQFSTLASAVTPIVDGTTDYGTTTSTLVVRARSSVITFVPMLGNLNVITSSAITRRQGT